MTAIIIQARIDSTRLPGKIFLDLVGKPMLWHVVKRCQYSKMCEKIIVATTINKEDNAVEKFCRKNKILFFRGSAENVLDRYCQTAKHYGTKVIVRVTSDCPLVDPSIIDEAVEKFFKKKYDYISNVNPVKRIFPQGLDVEVFSFEALEKAHQLAGEDYEKEHVTPYIWENKRGEFIIGPTVRAPLKYARAYRLTVDYLEDFILMKKIYQTLYKNGEIINILDVISFLDKNPTVAKTNAHCKQKPLKEAIKHDCCY